MEHGAIGALEAQILTEGFINAERYSFYHILFSETTATHGCVFALSIISNTSAGKLKDRLLRTRAAKIILRTSFLEKKIKSKSFSYLAAVKSEEILKTKQF